VITFRRMLLNARKKPKRREWNMMHLLLMHTEIDQERLPSSCEDQMQECASRHDIFPNIFWNFSLVKPYSIKCVFGKYVMTKIDFDSINCD
jgi:hypothetical protein